MPRKSSAQAKLFRIWKRFSKRAIWPIGLILQPLYKCELLKKGKCRQKEAPANITALLKF